MSDYAELLLIAFLFTMVFGTILILGLTGHLQDSTVTVP